MTIDYDKLTASVTALSTAREQVNRARNALGQPARFYTQQARELARITNKLVPLFAAELHKTLQTEACDSADDAQRAVLACLLLGIEVAGVETPDVEAACELVRLCIAKRAEAALRRAAGGGD